MRKFLSVLLAMAMVLSLTVTGFAIEDTATTREPEVMTEEATMAGKTVIMIAHRLSTVVGATRSSCSTAAARSRRAPMKSSSPHRGTYAKMWEPVHGRRSEWGIESAPGGDEARSSEAVAPHAAQDASAGEHDPAEKPGKPSNGRAPWLQRRSTFPARAMPDSSVRPRVHLERSGRS